MQVEQFLEESARRWPQKVALVCGEERLTFSELDRKATHLARSMAAEGVARADRVVICLENSSEAVIAIFAALKAGAVFVIAHPSSKAERLRYIVENAGAVLLVTNGGKLSACPDLLAVPTLKAILVDGPMPVAFADKPVIVGLQKILRETPAQADPLPKRCIDMDLAALIYTSGSAGRPKGVMLTHLNMVSASNSVIEYLENNERDVILSVLPLAFSYGLYQVLTGFKVGATVVLERSFAYPAAILDRVARERVTGIPIIPTISALLLQMDLRKWDCSSLRYITNAGAALPAAHIEKLRRILPHVKLFSMYGLTECKRVSYLPPEQIDVRPGSVGRGMPNEEVYIVDENGGRVGPGVVGELVVRGSHVMVGYWQMPAETARALRPGRYPWERVLYSGDLFRADEEGYLYFVSRKDDMIKVRGEKVSPREIEEVLYKLSGVAEAAVYGVPDVILGSAVCASVVLQPGAHLTRTDILRHCAANLEDVAVPRHIDFRTEMPRTSSGKIAKRELISQFSETKLSEAAS